MTEVLDTGSNQHCFSGSDPALYLILPTRVRLNFTRCFNKVCGYDHLFERPYKSLERVSEPLQVRLRACHENSRTTGDNAEWMISTRSVEESGEVLPRKIFILGSSSLIKWLDTSKTTSNLSDDNMGYKYPGMKFIIKMIHGSEQMASNLTH